MDPPLHLGRTGLGAESGVPLSEIGGVLPGTRDVGGADQTAALTARVEAFWLRWEKEARSDMLHRVEAETRKMAEAQREDVAFEPFAGGKSSVVPRKRARGRPPKVPGKVSRVSPATQTSELLRVRSGNELLKGKVALLEDQMAERDARPAALGGERQRADVLLKERDSQPLVERIAATRAESASRTREKELLDELEAARGQRGKKRTAPELVSVAYAGGCRGGQDLADALCR